MKRYLADTHALIWFLTTPSKLGGRAARVFGGLGASTEVSVSVLTLWEVALLYDEGHLRLPSGFSAWCDALEGLRGIRIEPILRNDVEEARALGSLNDPFDRLIAGTARRLGVPLLSRDARMTGERRLRVVW
ncbi:MAG TPA: type II toxin-antitoxin system VapC family toxin [Polyangiaceae bacterium]